MKNDKEFDSKKVNEYILKEARDLHIIIYEITKSSPKEFRYDLVNKMRNYSIELVDEIEKYMQVYINSGFLSRKDRLDHKYENLENSSSEDRLITFILDFVELRDKGKLFDERLTHLNNSRRILNQIELLVTTSRTLGILTNKQIERVSKQILLTNNLINKAIGMNGFKKLQKSSDKLKETKE